MKLQIIEESGYKAALFGAGLSFGICEPLTYQEFCEDGSPELARMKAVASKLFDKDGGHNKFLETITMVLDITATRAWHSEMDTYRSGVTKQSSSTMHTLQKTALTQKHFLHPVDTNYLEHLNWMIATKTFTIEQLKSALPEGFLQRRIVSTNYKAMRNIIKQRTGHRLQSWAVFIEAVMSQCEHPELLGELTK